jgi:hypothetical protein
MGKKVATLLVIMVLITPLLLTGCAEKAPEQLVPEGANLLLYLDLNKILADEDLVGIYDKLLREIPRDGDAPRKFEDTLDKIKEETGLEVEDFSEAWVFGDLGDLMEDGDYFGVIVKGNFDEDKLVEVIEDRGGEELSVEDYRGYQIYVDEQEERGVTFPHKDILLLGSIEAIKDVIDIGEGDGERIGGEIYDTFTSLPADALVKLALELPEELTSQITEEKPPAGIPISLASFARMELVSFASVKEGGYFRGETKLYFSDEDAAQDSKDTLEGMILLFKGLIDIDEIKALLDKMEVSLKGSEVRITSRTTVDEIKGLIELVVEKQRGF